MKLNVIIAVLYAFALHVVQCIYVSTISVQYSVQSVIITFSSAMIGSDLPLYDCYTAVTLNSCSIGTACTVADRSLSLRAAAVFVVLCKHITPLLVSQLCISQIIRYRLTVNQGNRQLTGLCSTVYP